MEIQLRSSTKTKSVCKLTDKSQILLKLKAIPRETVSPDEMSRRQFFNDPDVVDTIFELIEEGWTYRQIANGFHDSGLAGTVGSIYEGVSMSRRAGAQRHGKQQIGKRRGRGRANATSPKKSSASAISATEDTASTFAHTGASELASNLDANTGFKIAPSSSQQSRDTIPVEEIASIEVPEKSLFSRPEPDIASPKTSGVTYSVPDILRRRNDKL